jgi:spore coat protein CotF
MDVSLMVVELESIQPYNVIKITTQTDIKVSVKDSEEIRKETLVKISIETKATTSLTKAHIAQW